jgi:hypothetical protein
MNGDVILVFRHSHEKLRTGGLEGNFWGGAAVSTPKTPPTFKVFWERRLHRPAKLENPKLLTLGY